jgi:hypothetical protein
MNNKRGLSAIIITLIIVGLSLVAVGIVWGVVSNLLQSSEEQTTSQYDTLFLDMKVEKVALEDDGISVSVSRGSGGGTISGVAITISDGENTKVIKREVSDFEQLEQKTFSITSSEMGDVVFVKSVSVSPLIQNSVGNILDSLESDYFYSCLAILNYGNSNGDGMYTIDIDGVGSEKPIQVYCDMTTDGGGWTRIDYSEDLPLENRWTTGDNWRWLDEDFNMKMTLKQIQLLQSVSSEGKQIYNGSCKGVVHYFYPPSSSYSIAFGFKFANGEEIAGGVQNMGGIDFTVLEDGCSSNNAAVLEHTSWEIRDKRVPIMNVRSNDNGNSGEQFGSELTKNPAWLR